MSWMIISFLKNKKGVFILILWVWFFACTHGVQHVHGSTHWVQRVVLDHQESGYKWLCAIWGGYWTLDLGTLEKQETLLSRWAVSTASLLPQSIKRQPCGMWQYMSSSLVCSWLTHAFHLKSESQRGISITSIMNVLGRNYSCCPSRYTALVQWLLPETVWEWLGI